MLVFFPKIILIRLNSFINFSLNLSEKLQKYIIFLFSFFFMKETQFYLSTNKPSGLYLHLTFITLLTNFVWVKMYPALS